jgi:hypothetical protein
MWREFAGIHEFLESRVSGFLEEQIIIERVKD